MGSAPHSVRRGDACERCKNRKVRCNRTNDEPCTTCRLANATCTSAGFKEKPHRSSRLVDTSYSANVLGFKCSRPSTLISLYRLDRFRLLEQRLDRIESTVERLRPGTALAEDASYPESNIQSQAKPSDMLALILVGNDGETQFIGTTSALSVLSPGGLQWLSTYIGANNVNEMMAGIAKVSQSLSLWVANISLTLKSTGRQNPPAKQVARLYVDRFFRDINAWIPLYDRSEFDVFFERQYSDNPPLEASWYAVFNMILCLGCFAFHKPPHSTEHQIMGLRFFTNATTVLQELTFGNIDDTAIQALLMMIVTLQSLLLFQTSSLLLSIVVRAVLGKGFHRPVPGQVATTENIIKRQNIFWVAYLLDREMSLRTGLPALIDDDDIGISMPSMENAFLSNGTASDLKDTSYFPLAVELALIQAKICKWLYSPHFCIKPVKQQANLIQQLDRLLETWKESIPAQWQIGQDSQCQESGMNPVMYLHMAYYYSLSTIHRVSLEIFMPPEQRETAKEQCGYYSDQFETSAKVCLSAARATLDLFWSSDYVLALNPLASWPVCFHLLAAALLVFVHVVSSPILSEARSDISYLQLYKRLPQAPTSVAKTMMDGRMRAFADLLLNIAISTINQKNGITSPSPAFLG